MLTEPILQTPNWLILCARAQGKTRNLTAIFRRFSWRITFNSLSMAAILFQRCSALKHAGHYQNYAPCSQSVHTRTRVTATYPWDMYPQHFHVCANVVILSLLNIPATRHLSVY